MATAKRWHDVRKSTIVPGDQLPTWLSAKFHDVSQIIGSLKPLIAELNKAFGPPGQPGNDEDILAVCRLIVLAAKNLLEWEEDVRFVRVEEQYEMALLSMHGLAARQLDQLLRIPNELSKILAMENPKGLHELELVFTVPDGFADNFNRTLERAFGKVRDGR